MLEKLGVAQRLVVLGVDIAHIVPGRTGAAGHGRGLPDAVDAVFIVFLPLGGIFQRGLTVFALVIFQFRQNQRQLLVGEEVGLPVVGVHAGHRLAPVALAGENPLPEVVVVLPAGNAHVFQLAGDGFFRFLHRQAGEFL